MGLPNVDITLDNGAIGGTPASNDGISGLIFTGATVAGANKVTLGNPYVVFSLKEAIDLGIEATGSNAYSYSHIKEFYDNAGNGSELWLMLVGATITMEDMLDKTKAYAPILLDKAKGKIRKLGVSRKSATGVTIANGLDEDVDKALIKGQALADEYAKKFKPFRFVVDGKDSNGNVGDLKDYKTASFNRGGVLLGATLAGKNAGIGFVIGYMASLPVHRKISRVKNGALPISEAYFTDTKETETLENAWGSIHNKEYIFFRTFIGKSGYFFNDDPTATALTDDYATFSRGFVIDKALVLTYLTYVEEIGDEIEVDDDGKLNAALIKDLQGSVGNAIELQMITAGEASAVQAIIDPNQNILATNKLNITLRVRPVGYKNFIDVLLGFENPANN